MQHFKKISSLKEDFERLGLVKASASDPVDDNTDNGVIEESTETKDENIEEARLVAKRVKRMKPSARAKARLSQRKRKSKIKRRKKVRSRKAKFKMRVKRVKALKKGRKAGIRRRFKLVQGLEQQANLLESLKTLQLELSGNPEKELVQAFESVSKLAGTLARKFAVVEDVLLEMEALPVEHPESESGEEGASNVKAGGKEGDATDTVKDAPKGNVKAETVSVPTEDTDMSCDDDDDDNDWSDDEDGDEDSEDMGSDDSEDDDDDMDEDTDQEGDDLDEDFDMHLELASLKMEADDVLNKMTQHTLTPAQASSILKDMVQYLGGAMGMYLDVAKDVQDSEYIGQDMPDDENNGPMPDKDNMHKVIGKDLPVAAGGSVEAAQGKKM